LHVSPDQGHEKIFRKMFSPKETFMKLIPCFISATLALKASLGKNAKSGMFVAHVSTHTTRLVQQTQGLLNEA
jgi:hypothetical protein